MGRVLRAARLLLALVGWCCGPRGCCWRRLVGRVCGVWLVLRAARLLLALVVLVLRAERLLLAPAGGSCEWWVAGAAGRKAAVGAGVRGCCGPKGCCWRLRQWVYA